MKANTNMKASALLLCASFLCAVSVFSTIAFLKSDDSVENTFTVGKVSVSLDESKVDEYGTADAAADRVKANTYKLIPGHRYTKNPTVHFAADSEASYLFVKVENGLAEIETDAEADAKIEAQILANGWEKLDGAANVFFRKVDANSTDSALDYAVFGSFTLDENAEVARYEHARITVTAYAIQSDGFDSASAAWAAGAF